MRNKTKGEPGTGKYKLWNDSNITDGFHSVLETKKKEKMWRQVNWKLKIL